MTLRWHFGDSRRPDRASRARVLRRARGFRAKVSEPSRRRHIDILITNDLDGGGAPFTHGDLQVAFHKLDRSGELPLLDGALWAFVDWVLPEISGLELCRRLRCDPLTAQAHVTMILEEDDQDARRRALRTGADDYMVGPITRAALLDRVLSLKLNDPNEGALRALALGGLTIDLAAFQARWHGKPVPLMPNEFRLLRYFVEHPGRVFTLSLIHI